MPKYSFLILTYNSSSYIRQLIESIFANLENDIFNKKIELIIVDNNSSDNSVQIIEKYFKNRKEIIAKNQDHKTPVFLHVSKENVGYAKGINLAASFARGELIVVINPDSILVDFDSEKISVEFDENKKLVAAGFQILNFDGIKEKNAGTFFNPINFLLYAMGFEKLTNLRFSPEEKESIDFISGGFVAFRKDVFDKLGGYDKDYFMYVEDYDICYRIKKEGFETQYLPHATIKHKGQGSSNREFAIVNIYKGLNFFYKKHSNIVMQLYVRNLLRIKAALIIFIGTLMLKKDLSRTYIKAFRALS